MLREVPCDGTQPRLRRQEMDFLREFRLQFFHFVHIQIGRFDGVQNAVVDFRITEIKNLFAAVFVVERDGRAVFNGAFEVVDGHIAAEGAGRDVVVGQQRRSREADARRRRKHLHHVVRENAVLRPMGFVRHEDDVMVWANRFRIRIVELLDQREDEAWVAVQFPHQIRAAGGDVLACLGCLSEQAAVFKRVADLAVQFIAIRQNHDGWRTRELPADFLRQKRHGIAFSAALRMPEDAQFAVVELAVRVGFGRFIDAQILMVARHDFGGVAVGMVVEDEIFKKVEKVLLFADAAQHGRQFDAAFIFFLEPFPVMEEFVSATERAHFRGQSIGENQKGVGVEQLRDGVQIVRIVVGIGVLHIHIRVFEFNEQQRNAVDKTDDVRPSAIQIAVDFHLLDRQKAIVLRILEVDDGGAFFLRAAVRMAIRHVDAVANHGIFLFIDLQKRRSGKPLAKRRDGFVDLRRRDPWIEFLERRADVTRQQDFLVILPPERAVFAQNLLIISIDDLPAQFVVKQRSCAFLNQDVFGIVVAHG